MWKKLTPKRVMDVRCCIVCIKGYEEQPTTKNNKMRGIEIGPLNIFQKVHLHIAICKTALVIKCGAIYNQSKTLRPTIINPYRFSFSDS